VFAATIVFRVEQVAEFRSTPEPWSSALFAVIVTFVMLSVPDAL
jgi:hypothetical protein